MVNTLSLTKIDQEHIRQSVVLQTASVWNTSEKKINSCIKRIISVLSEEDSKDRLKESFRILKGISDALSFNGNYIREEDPLVFKELWFRLIETFKNLFESFAMEDDSYTARDLRIDDMAYDFFERIAWMRGLAPNIFVKQGYPPVTVVIRTVRNQVEHNREKPKDPITKKKSFGNIFTLTSVYILSIYAYMEILDIWAGTIC